ncbi:GNAT family N-acetyltransferase [Sphingomonas aerolata]|uniref:GNAT family N-acetyltransferase n=1 Tax=Sphingomonas aerolata TaxID=185951 RepID=UPI002FE003B8
MKTDLSLGNRPDLATERLSLRRPNDRDVDAIVGVVGNWEVARRLARVPHPYGPADARFFLDHVIPAEWVWAVTLLGSDTLLGVIGLTPEEGADAAELGYWLSPAHWGSGITTEAARAVVAFGSRTSRPSRHHIWLLCGQSSIGPGASQARLCGNRARQCDLASR